MKTVMSYVFPLVVGIFGIFHSNLASAAVTSNVIIPLVTTDFVPCANNGTGELVDLTGNLHILAITTTSGSGNVTMKLQFNPQGVTGIGRTTGDIYQGTGVTTTITTFDSITGYPVVSNFLNRFRLIGKGPGANYLNNQSIHITINANGTVTALIDNTSAICK